MFSSIHRRTIAPMLALTLAAGVAACEDDPASPPSSVAYEGTLEGVEPYADMTGEISLERWSTMFEIALELSDHPEAGDEGFPWILRAGSCEDPGDEIGELDDYPRIEPDEDGSWDDEVPGQLGSATTFVFELRSAEEDEEETVIGCGEITTTD